MALPRNLKIDDTAKARVGARLIRLARQYERALSEKLAPWKLAPTHLEVLKFLYTAPDYSATHSQIADATGITLPSVTLAVRKLAALKLVGRDRGSDRRQRIVTLGVKGAEQLGMLYDITSDLSESVFGDLSDADARKLERIADKLLARFIALDE